MKKWSRGDALVSYEPENTFPGVNNVTIAPGNQTPEPTPIEINYIEETYPDATDIPGATATPKVSDAEFPKENTDLGNDVAETTEQSQTEDQTLVGISEDGQPERATISLSTFLIASGILFVCACILTLVLTHLFRKIVSPKKKKNQKISNNTGFFLSVGNMQGIGKREKQEDAFGTSDLVSAAKKGVLAVVADGMGGLSRGEEISNTAVRSILGNFKTDGQGLSEPQLLLKLVYEANRKACDLSSNGESGSTLLLALIRNEKLYFATVGDSRIYLFRNGNLLLLNRPHVYAYELDARAARNEMTVETANTDRQRSGLTSYIGMGELEKVDFNEEGIPLVVGDRVMLMSDGVFGTLTEKEIALLVTERVQETAERINKAVQEKKKENQDNYTAVILQVQ